MAFGMNYKPFVYTERFSCIKQYKTPRLKTIHVNISSVRYPGNLSKRAKL